jgi:hypothetical protein
VLEEGVVAEAGYGEGREGGGAASHGLLAGARGGVGLEVGAEAVPDAGYEEADGGAGYDRRVHDHRVRVLPKKRYSLKAPSSS